MLELFLYILSLLPPAVVAFIAGYLAAKITSKFKVILLGVIAGVIIFCYNMIILQIVK